MLTFLELLAGTVIYRPYVYGFFACFLFFSLRHLRPGGALIYLVTSYLLAFACEYSSTRNGFPFGIYTYIDDTRTRELWVSNVPFWDSLSFVFLSYFGWILAAYARSPAQPASALMKPGTAALAGLLMMLLDVVIDPVTLQGDQWFLGRIYYYPNGGMHFGVPLSNYAGWFFVGAATVLVNQRLFRSRALGSMSPLMGWMCLGVYAGVFVFNLAIAAWIRRWDLFFGGLIVTTATLAPLLWRLSRRTNLVPTSLQGTAAT